MLMSDTTDSETRSCKMSIPQSFVHEEEMGDQIFSRAASHLYRLIASVRIAPAQLRLQAPILCISMSYGFHCISVLFSIPSSVLLS
ncbi:hypothetical protein QR46_4945 [Giardia duodenalis assemblage B]|uniref:Uncharacterized protein n=1 Tax=Giardia duodenalis assemblage B TaxID=1394984 RepID=A0A132NM10_GIAIN|nr:hypothetical protein QR46_4945 [Giardia intestinalis assemblage B]